VPGEEELFTGLQQHDRFSKENLQAELRVERLTSADAWRTVVVADSVIEREVAANGDRIACRRCKVTR